MVNIEQLIKIAPGCKSRAAKFIDGLNATMVEFEINTKKRRAAFLAQLMHESGQLVYVKELASGAAYEMRKVLGNVVPGDGVRYKGRGLIQITGRANYASLSHDLKIDCVNNPAILEEPINACRSAGWFWNSRKLNAMADEGDFLRITHKINGGENGWKERLMYYTKAMEVLC